MIHDRNEEKTEDSDLVFASFRPELTLSLPCVVFGLIACLIHILIQIVQKEIKMSRTSTGFCLKRKITLATAPPVNLNLN